MGPKTHSVAAPLEHSALGTLSSLCAWPTNLSSAARATARNWYMRDPPGPTEASPAQQGRQYDQTCLLPTYHGCHQPFRADRHFSGPSRPLTLLSPTQKGHHERLQPTKATQEHICLQPCRASKNHRRHVCEEKTDQSASIPTRPSGASPGQQSGQECLCICVVGLVGLGRCLVFVVALVDWRCYCWP